MRKNNFLYSMCVCTFAWRKEKNMDYWEKIYWENFPNSPKCGIGVALNTNSLKLYEMQPSSTEFMKPAN